MAKRFTDTEKWEKNWYWNLSTKNKVLWQYLLDKCDHAGFIEIDARRVSRNINEEFSIEEIEFGMGKHLIRIKNYLYWIPKFIQFQYTERQFNVAISTIDKLNNNDSSSRENAITSIIRKLTKYEINWKFENSKFTYNFNSNTTGIVAATIAAKDKDKDKDKDKEGNSKNIALINDAKQTTNNEQMGEKDESSNVNIKLKSDAIRILEFLNKESSRNFRAVSATLEPIMARLKQGYSVKDITRVIWYKCKIDPWYLENPKFQNPQTLMRASKFPIFLEEVNSYSSGRNLNEANS